MSQQKNNFRLTKRDREILAHVVRDRLTTVAVLQKRLASGLSRNAVTKITRRLCQAGYLQSYPLRYPVEYFVLGEVAAQLLGIGRRRIAPLGPQALPQEYAVLLYTSFSKQPRRRLTKSELRSSYHWMSPQQLEAPHCLELSTNTLEFIRVDLGAPVDHLARKCVKALKQQRQSAEFQKLVDGRKLRFVLITATPDKAAALQQAMQRHEWPAGLAMHCSIISELLFLHRSLTHA